MFASQIVTLPLRRWMNSEIVITPLAVFGGPLVYLSVPPALSA
jgi:hypothetical protein